MSTYWISGANGFLGKAVCKYLEQDRHLIVKHDRRKDYFNELQFANVVVHLSAYGNHYHQTDPQEIIDRNISDLVKMIDVAKRAALLEKFYNISTSSITLPTQTMYSASKLFGETLINSLKDERFVNVRPYSVYGPGEAEHRFIPTVIRHLKSGEQMPLDPYAVHDFIFVDDFVTAMFEGHKEIGSGTQTTNLTIVNLLEEISGKKLKYYPTQMRNYDTKNWVCKNGVPCRTLQEGLKLTYESY